MKSARVSLLGLAAASLALSIAAWWGMIQAFPLHQGGDGFYFYRSLEATRMSLRFHHELPFWNPYECGGVPLWDNPQGLATSPLAELLLLFGSNFALDAWYVIHSAIGFFGMWLLTRRVLSLGYAGSLLGSAAFAFSGFHWQHYSGGHASFVGFEFFPLALYLWRTSELSIRRASLLGFLLGWMLLGASTYPLPHLLLLLGAETLTRIFSKKRALGILRSGAIVGVIAFLVGAAKLLPLLAQFAARPRGLGPEHDTLNLHLVTEMFLARTHEWPVPGQAYVWPEYGAFVGPTVIAFFFLGLLFVGRARLWLLPLFVLTTLLMWGHFAEWAPWSVLKGHIFPFKEMRVPSRFVASVTLFVAAFAGIGVDRATEFFESLASGTARRLALSRAVFVVAMLGVGDLLLTPLPWIQSRFVTPTPAARPAPVARFYLDGPALPGPLELIAQNRGSAACFEDWGDLSGAKLWSGDVPQARAIDANIVVEVANRTANTFTIDVDAAHAGRVLLNSNYDRNWSSDVGVVVPQGKQLAIDVPEGRHRLNVRYRPARIAIGITLTILGFLLTILLATRGDRLRAMFVRKSPSSTA